MDQIQGGSGDSLIFALIIRALFHAADHRKLTCLLRAVSFEERDTYIEIIDGILITADLETISRKKIRQGLESALGGKDLSDQKVGNPFASSYLAK